MKNNHFTKFAILFTALILAGCGGKSDITGEMVPIESVCRYEKLKPVAVEGFLAPKTMNCEKTGGKRKSVIGCSFMLYADSSKSGTAIPVYILKSSWLSSNQNRIENPEEYTGEIVFRNNAGEQLPKKDLRIYDNEGNLIPAASKIRVYSKLPDNDRCEFALVERIDKVW